MIEKITGVLGEEENFTAEKKEVQSADLDLFKKEIKSKDPLAGRIDYEKLDLNSYAMWYDFLQIKASNFNNEKDKEDAIKRFRDKIERLKHEYAEKGPNYIFLEYLIENV